MPRVPCNLAVFWCSDFWCSDPWVNLGCLGGEKARNWKPCKIAICYPKFLKLFCCKISAVANPLDVSVAATGTASPWQVTGVTSPGFGQR